MPDPAPDALIGPTRDERLHAMTYNLRFPADDPGHWWPERRPAMAALLALEQPTVLATQEGWYGQLRDLEADLPSSYAWVGLGREGGSRGEFVAVFYDSDRLDAIEYDHFWLSDTPAVIGSTSWGNRTIRMVTWVRFHDHVTATEFVVLNTHLDNASEPARRRGAEVLRATAESFGTTPVVVTGDFNTAAGSSEPYQELVGTGRLSDTWVDARKRITPAYATYAGYEPPTVGGKRIDWILTSPGVTTDVAAINPFAHDGRFPSDHLPVQALLSLP